MEEITITITKKEMDLITQSLCNLPFGQVVNLMNKIASQVIEQQNKEKDNGK